MAFVSRSAMEERPTPWIGATTGDRMGLVLLATIYVKVFFTFSPFKRGLSDAAEGAGDGSTINQIYWLGILAFASFVIWRNWATAMVLLRRTWIYFLPFAWFAITLLWTPDVDVTLRRTILVVLMAGVAFGVAAARPSPTDFLNTSALVLGTILLFSVISVFVVPGLARGGGGQFLGIYSHKNGAGYVSAVCFLFWVFFMVATTKFEVKVMALFGCMLWLFFLVGAQSKTSLGLALLMPMIAAALYYVLRLDLHWRIMAYIVGGILAGVIIWAVLYIDWGIEDVGVLIFDDLTFTNRTNVWEYVIRSIEERPLLGYGFGAFWKVGDGVYNRLGADLSAGWAATAGSAHNGFLNIWLESGLIGLVICLFIMLLVLRGSVRLLKQPEQSSINRWVFATLFALTVFLILRDMMESSLYMAHSGSTMLLFLISYLIALWRWQSEQRMMPPEPEQRRALPTTLRRLG